jgi:dethiobiotin synthetase
VTTRGLFVTGTDTGVGKTVVTVLLLRALAEAGRRAVGMKPVAAGVATGELRNADVRLLIDAGNVDAPAGDVNPYSLRLAAAPELAASGERVSIGLDAIASAYSRLQARADAVVVEGAGGALVPLSRHADMLDIPAQLGIPVLLVVGIRLGCLNHALLSALAINARGVRFAGWVANRIDPAMKEADANVAMLAERLPAPLVADVRWAADAVPSFDDPRRVVRLLGFESAPA